MTCKVGVYDGAKCMYGLRYLGVSKYVCMGLDIWECMSVYVWALLSGRVCLCLCMYGPGYLGVYEWALLRGSI